MDCVKKRKAENANQQPQIVVQQNTGMAGSRYAQDDGYGPNAGGLGYGQQQPQMAMQPGYGQPVAQPMQGYAAQPIMAQPMIQQQGQMMPQYANQQAPAYAQQPQGGQQQPQMAMAMSMQQQPQGQGP